MLTRKKTWEELLSIYIANAHDREFVWGQHDCASFAAGAIKAVTGHDLTDLFAGQYGDLRQAAQWLKTKGYRSFQEAVTDQLGGAVHPAQAGRGDIVMRRVGNGNVLGVCVGKHCWFLGDEVVAYDEQNQPITQPALVSWPTLLCDVAWKIAPYSEQ